jgi:hypothetical protein
MADVNLNSLPCPNMERIPMHDITPISEPIHIAAINGMALRFFRSPVKDPDMPWFAIEDMLRCFGLAHVGGIIMSNLKNSEWSGDVRPAVTADGLVEIAPHYMAQGFWALRRGTMVAIGREFIAILSTNERGPVERRKAGTRKQAFAAARVLLDVAERWDWHRGEIVSVRVEQAEE